MVGLVILIVFGVLFLAAIVRLVWRTSRGDIEIAPASHGRQIFGRGEKKRNPD